MPPHAPRRRPVLLALGAALVTAACSGAPSDGSTAADTLTRRQKDSIISTLPIPGAGAVGRALDATDSIAARGRRLDSIR